MPQALPRNPVAALLFIALSILRPPPVPPPLLLLKVAAKIKEQRAAWQAFKLLTDPRGIANLHMAANILAPARAAGCAAEGSCRHRGGGSCLAGLHIGVAI